MKKALKTIPILLIINSFYFCNKKTDIKEETILKGNLKILVDESIKPIVEDEIMIFENDYEAKITIDAKSEVEILQSLFKDSMRVAVLSSKLSKTDSLYFVTNKKVVPKQTPFAIDGIALITNKKSNDTLIDLEQVINLMQGKKSTVKGLVFDNPNSSSVRLMLEKSGLKEIPKNGVYSFKTNEEVLKFVSENAGMIGVVGVNWLSTPIEIVKKFKENINILYVKDIGGKEYFYPSQESMGRKKYPLARNLYIINCQGYSGLGMGFASFVAGERGQRIVNQSGLAPAIMPSMNIHVTKSITNEK